MGKKKQKAGQKTAVFPRMFWLLASLITGLFLLLTFATEYESYTSLYDANYVGSETCSECHTVIYSRWQVSPHANMTRRPNPESVVGDFAEGSWFIPAEARRSTFDELSAIRTYTENGNYYMALRQPDSDEYVSFKIEYVIGYQYRQTYLTLESGGVLRRLPLEWSVERQEFFPYWNMQENSLPTMEDLWAQMTSLNSAWNLFCARCHTTHLTILDKDASHTYAVTEWTDEGIACEACHGPGGHHVNYYAHNYVNRMVAFVNGRIRNQPTAYIANPAKLTAGQDLSVCGRCHGPDITMATTEVYRVYEPGYSQEGRINDLSPYFKQMPLEPGRTNATVEIWADGMPKGIAMIFRSFIESACYAQAEVRCYDCHDPHQNGQPTVEGILEPSAVSDAYCLGCHTELAQKTAEHTHHEPGTSGSFCYDCHMPREVIDLVGGRQDYTRTHWMSSLPDPQHSELYGLPNAPNACNECHTDQTAVWAIEQMQGWWGTASTEIQLVNNQ